MLPLELTVKGLGPYLSVTISEKDFRTIQDGRLFLIYGEIGAGKTTLFDAILFALYGEASFPERKIKDLISHHLKTEHQITPEVSLRFLFSEREIKVKRKLTNPDSRGEVFLWIDGSLRTNRPTVANQVLKEILRLDHKQFKKVVLLPQGEYREVLLAEKEERIALFEKLFQLEIFTNFENFLKEKNKELEGNIKNLRGQFDSTLNLAEVQDLEELRGKLRTIDTTLGKLKAEKEIIKEELKAKEKRLKDLEILARLLEEKERTERELQELHAKSGSIHEMERTIVRLRILKDVYPYYEELRKRWKILRELKIKEKETSAKIKEVEEREQKLKTKIDELLSEKDRIEALKEKKVKIVEMLKVIDKREKSIEELNVVNYKLKEASVKRELLEKERQALLLLQELQDLEKEYKLLLRIKELQARNRELQEKLQHQQKLLQEKIAEYERCRDVLDLTKIAGRLTEGEPCPLCGSTTHPRKATSQLEDFKRLSELEREIGELKESLSRITEAMVSVKAEAETLQRELKCQDEALLKGRIEELTEGLRDTKVYFDPSDVFTIEHIKSRLEAITKEEKELIGQRHYLFGKKEKLEEQLRSFSEKISELGYKDRSGRKVLQEELSNIEREIHLFDESFEKVQESYRNTERELNKLSGILDELRASLLREVSAYRQNLSKVFVLKKKGFFRTISELKATFLELKNLENFEAEVAEYRRKLLSLQEALSKVEVELRAYQEHQERPLKDIVEELPSLKQELEVKRGHELRLEGELSRLEESRTKLKQLEESLSRLSLQIEETEQEKRNIESIVNLISGKRVTVSLKSYATSLFLSRLLRRTNQYLKEFSFGRYRFELEAALSKDFGLYVFDAYTGKTREVRTLSGGESFIAVLSFALGVSDLMQILHGSKPFQSFFIDEGFGSLDGHTLDRVVQILVDVSQKSDRVVGVISHLADLRDRFPTRVEVIKDAEGISKVLVKKVF